MYENSRDPPMDQPQNAWQVLANTEQWISNTLASASSGPSSANPYSRKEVSYVCEQHSESPLILANIFRLLKEARERGENHGAEEEERAEEQGAWTSNLI
jgi:hypothetical protein